MIIHIFGSLVQDHKTRINWVISPIILKLDVSACQ